MAERAKTAEKKGVKVARTTSAQQGVTPTPTEDNALLLLRERVRQQDEQLAQYKAQQEQASQDICKLQEQRDVLEKEHYHAANALRQQVADAEHRAQQASTLASHTQTTAQEERQKATDRDLLVTQQFKATEIQLLTQVAALKTQLATLGEFTTRRDELEAALLTAQHEIASAQASHDSEMASIHLRAHRLEQECDRLRAETAQRHAEMMGKAEGGGSDLFKLMQHNSALADQLKATQKEVAEQQKRTDAMAEKYRTSQLDLKRSVSLEKAAVEQCNRQAQAAMAAKTATAKMEARIQELEAGLGAGVERENMWRAKLTAATEDVKSLQQQLALKSKEIRRLWRAQQLHHQQQSEVVSFLVTSIRAVKQHIAADQPTASSTANSHTCSPTTQPAAYNSGSPTRKSSPTHFATSLRETLIKAGGRVDVSQLTWQEREHVLRLLLAHVNASRAVSVAGSSWSGSGPPSHASSIVSSPAGVPMAATPGTVPVHRDVVDADGPVGVQETLAAMAAAAAAGRLGSMGAGTFEAMEPDEAGAGESTDTNHSATLSPK